VLDGKNEHLGWAIYDPHSPLSLRILSLKKNPPNDAYFEELFSRALSLRKSIINSGLNSETSSYRLFNGEGDHLPGMICDIYGEVAVLQFDGKGPREFWPKTKVAQWLLNNVGSTSVVEKVRRPTEEQVIQLLAGKECSSTLVIKENNVLFKVDIDTGQKTGFFLDQRDNRKYVQSLSKGKTVLNLFSYTGGFSVYAGLGGAAKVASLDVAAGAIAFATENWALNKLEPQNHVGLCVDVFEYLNEKGEMWDYVLVDPPSMSHSEE
jgi:23S rRNA (cytosine1962-C5)-methyltransferase